MNLAKCPHCGVKLGNFMYADACPHCHTTLGHNRTPTLSIPKPDPRRERAWPVKMFMRFMRFVES